MAIYKRRFKRPTRRGVRRTRRMRKVPRQIVPYLMPARFTTRMKYVEFITVTADKLAPQGYVYLANGIYDPRYAVGGHSAHGFDEMMHFYNHWVVIGSKIKVQHMHQAASDTALYSVLLSDTGNRVASCSGIEDLLESEHRSRQMRLYGNVALTDTTYRSEICKFSAKRFFKVKNVLDREDLQGGLTSDPSEKAYYEVFVYTFSDNESSTLMKIEIEYIVSFSGLMDVGISGSPLVSRAEEVDPEYQTAVPDP